MEGKTVGGGDREESFKAARRGRGYMCLRCFSEKGKTVINTRIRLERHILYNHLKSGQAPFMCSLCNHPTVNWNDLLKHFQKNIKHKNMINKEGIQDISPFLITNKNGYKFGTTDYKVMDKADSNKVFTKRAVESGERKNQLPLEVQECFRSGYFDQVMKGDKPEGNDFVQEKEFSATPIEVNRDQIVIERNHTISSLEEFDNAARINEESVKDVGSVDELVNKLGIDKESETYERDEKLDEGQKDSRHVISIEKMNQGTLATYFSKLIEATERNTRALERVEKLLVDNSVMISKNCGATTSLRWAIERYERNEDIREEGRQAYDRRMDDERRRETERWRRDAEQRAESRRKTEKKRREEEKADRLEGKEGRERSEVRDSRRDRWRFERMGQDKENNVLGDLN